MINNQREWRPIFDVLDAERLGQTKYESRISSAVDRAAWQADMETIRMYRSRGLELPLRLAKLVIGE